MDKKTIPVEQRTPFARESAVKCKKCERVFSGDKFVLKSFDKYTPEGIMPYDDGNPRKNSVTICSECGFETPFKHE